jgi:hypothetical protein
MAAGKRNPHRNPTQMNKTFIRATSAAACAVLLAACSAGNPLDVKNLNNPDVLRAYGTPAGVESIIGTTYQQFNNVWNVENVEVDAMMYGMEGFSTVANFCLNVYAAIPRNPIVNQVGGQCDSEQLGDFSGFQKLARNSANMVQALDAIVKGGGTTGTPAEDARDRGFALFVNAISLGELAIIYDSAAITTQTVPSTAIPPLSGYTDVMTAALAQMDSAIAVSGGAVAAPAFPIPAAWIAGNSFSQAQWLQWLHSWKARLRAGVARTPADRAAVNWADVIADAQAGITSDIHITVGGGWKCSYICSQMYSSNGWHEMTLMVLGMADTSGSYATFNAAPISSRDGSQTLIQTPDIRLPQGASRTAQNADTPYNGTSFVANRYFDNRLASDDFAGPGFGSSEYDYKRYLAIYKASGVGSAVQFPLSENTMLEAEGLIYAGNFTAAQVLIDASRALHGGLPSIGVITSATQPIQGGANSCVPHVPAPPSFNTLQCGNILEAMKWEKRMETAYSAYAPWYQDGRGWGDLVQGTALMWPVPDEEMNSRQEPYYNMGGLGLPNSAKIGTYGW